MDLYLNTRLFVTPTIKNKDYERFIQKALIEGKAPKPDKFFSAKTLKLLGEHGLYNSISNSIIHPKDFCSELTCHFNHLKFFPLYAKGRLYKDLSTEGFVAFCRKNVHARTGKLCKALTDHIPTSKISEFIFEFKNRYNSFYVKKYLDNAKDSLKVRAFIKAHPDIDIVDYLAKAFRAQPVLTNRIEASLSLLCSRAFFSQLFPNKKRYTEVQKYHDSF